MSYKIIRNYEHGRPKVVKTGLTLEEAQTHCRRDDTRGEGWFDAYDAEGPLTEADILAKQRAEQVLIGGMKALRSLGIL